MNLDHLLDILINQIFCAWKMYTTNFRYCIKIDYEIMDKNPYHNLLYFQCFPILQYHNFLVFPIFRKFIYYEIFRSFQYKKTWKIYLEQDFTNAHKDFDDNIKDNKERENIVCGKFKSCIFIALHNSLVFTSK